MSSASTGVILVTGGAGFIGSHAIDRLIRSGWKIIVVDDLSSGRMEYIAAQALSGHLFFVEADVADGLFVPLAPILKATGPIQAIVHLAAQTSVQRSISNPLHDARINHVGTLQVFEFARVQGVKKVVFISSAAIYGDDAPVPATESAPEMAISPYGVHKLSGEHIMKYYAKVHGVNGVALRLFNVYGSRQHPRSSYSGVISLFCSQSIMNSPMTIYGDGCQTRDFVHVSDVIDAIVAAIQYDAKPHSVFNIGSGSARRIIDVAEIIRSVCRSHSDIKHDLARAGDIRHSCADVSAASAALAYRPKVGIEQGLVETVSWIVEDGKSCAGTARADPLRGTDAEPV
jgi:UDP-glucose 4-epimerase